VWRAKNFYVFHSATGKLEAYSYPDVIASNGTFNLLDHVTGKGETNDYLYGGYYTTYGGLAPATLDGKTVTIADVIAREYDNNITTHSLSETASVAWNKSSVSGKDDCAVINLGAEDVKSLTGYQKYTGAVWKTSDNLPFWTKANAYNTANATQDNPVYSGTALVPTPGVVYYLKEVPADYLPARMIAVHETGNNQGADVNTGTISAIYLLTAVDDVTYRSYGFLKGETSNPTGTPQKSTISKKFKVYYKDKNGNVVLKNTYTAHDLSSGIGENDGYVVSYQVPVEPNKSAYILPTWITLDGVTVSQNQVMFHVSSDGQTVSWNP